MPLAGPLCIPASGLRAGRLLVLGVCPCHRSSAGLAGAGSQGSVPGRCRVLQYRCLTGSTSRLCKYEAGKDTALVGLGSCRKGSSVVARSFFSPPIIGLSTPLLSPRLSFAHRDSQPRLLCKQRAYLPRCCLLSPPRPLPNWAALVRQAWGAFQGWLSQVGC